MLGVVMDPDNLSEVCNVQSLERPSLEEVAVQQRSITDFFTSPKGCKLTKHPVTTGKLITTNSTKSTITNGKLISKKRKRTSEDDLNTSLSDFDSPLKGTKASKCKKAKSTNRVKKSSTSDQVLTLTDSPNGSGSQSGKENEDSPAAVQTPVVKGNSETTRNTNKMSDNRKRRSKVSKKLKTTENVTACQNIPRSNEKMADSVQSKEKETLPVTNDNITVEVSYEEFLQSEGVDLITNDTPVEDVLAPPQLSVPKCHKLEDYFKKKTPSKKNGKSEPLSPGDSSQSLKTEAEVHFEPPSSLSEQSKSQCCEKERRTSNVLISDEECDMGILEISSEVIEVSPFKRGHLKLESSESISIKAEVSTDTEMLISSPSTKSIGKIVKTTQATLSFTKQGLSACKQTKTDQETEISQDFNSPINLSNQCLSKVDKKVVKKNQCKNAHTGNSHSAGIVKKEKKSKSGGKEDCEIVSKKKKVKKKKATGNNEETFDSPTPITRRSPRLKPSSNPLSIDSPDNTKDDLKKTKHVLRRRYKVAKFESGGDNRSPIRIRLRRCSKSSNDEVTILTPIAGKKNQAKKSRTKAQQLVEKAKKAKKSSKLVDSGETKCGRGKDVKKQMTGSDKIKTEPKKLAPIFSKKKGVEPSTSKPTKPKTDIDPELLRQRQEFLKSSLPENLRNKSTMYDQDAVPDYPPIPTISHVQQEERNIVCSLPNLTYPVRQETTPALSPVGWCTEFSIHKPIKDSAEKKMMFKKAEEIGEMVKKHLLAEIQQNNPNFPTQRLYEILKAKRLTVCKDIVKTESDEKKSETVVVLDSPPSVTTGNQETKSVKSVDTTSATAGRKNRLRRKGRSKTTEEPSIEKPLEPIIPEISQNIPQPVAIVDQLWCDKYQPTESVEIIGNSGYVKKLKVWLQKWKERNDKEARLLQRLLKKQRKQLKQDDNQEESNDWWTDDESDFESTKADSDWMEAEDTLINTVLVTGPHGIGKSSTVYALAQELGYQVFEVNTTSSRSGKRILSKLQEATQSHQVCKQNLEKLGLRPNTPVKTVSNGPSPSNPAPTKMPTAFTNLFKKVNKTPDTQGEVIIVSGDSDKKKQAKTAASKRKRSLNKEEKIATSPKKKVKPEKISAPVKLPSLLGGESNSSSTLHSKGLNLASNSLILFDEVDVVFEEDKGFWASIQSFMNTSKRPIILTTTDPNFSEKFEGKFEQISLRRPTYSNVASYLQLVCLLENVRTEFIELLKLVQLLKGDVRGCLNWLQFWVESGGGLVQTLKPLSFEIDNTGKDLCYIDDTFTQSQDSNLGDTPFSQKSQSSLVLQDTEREVRSRRRILSDDSSLDSCSSPKKSQTIKSLKSIPELEISDENAMFASLTEISNPLNSLDPESNLISIHQLCLESLLGSTNFSKTSFCDALADQNIEICSSVLRLVSGHFSILDRPELFLPLPLTVIDTWPLRTSIETKTCTTEKSFSRLKSNVFTSDSSDSESVFEALKTKDVGDKNVFTMESEKPTPFSSQVTLSREKRQCVNQALKCFSELFERTSCVDLFGVSSSPSLSRYKDVPSLNRGNLLPGLSDDLPVFDSQVNSLSQEISTEIASRSMSICKEALTSVQQNVTTLEDPEFVEEYLTLPVPKGFNHLQMTEDLPIRNSTLAPRRKATGDVIRSLPLHTWCHSRSTSLDYAPVLRSICEAEQSRQVSKTKRRFLHYLDGISLPLRESTMSVLASSFR